MFLLYVTVPVEGHAILLTLGPLTAAQVAEAEADLSAMYPGSEFQTSEVTAH